MKPYPISAKTMYKTYSLDYLKKPYTWFPMSNDSNVHPHGGRITMVLIRSQE